MLNNLTYFDNYKMVIFHCEGLTNKETKETYNDLSKVMLDKDKPRYTDFKVTNQ